MSYSSNLTRQRIMKSAEKEFLKHGFPKATMQGIAQKAKVTTGALYNHFAGKEILFKALVEDTAEGYIRLVEKEYEKYCDFGVLFHTMQTAGQANVSSELLLNFIYDHFTAFKLIICCSEGTAYAKYVDCLVALQETAIHGLLKEAVSNGSDTLDAFFIHVICSMGVKNMFEIIEHDLPIEKALIYVEKMRKFHLSGWMGIIENFETSRDKATIPCK